MNCAREFQHIWTIYIYVSVINAFMYAPYKLLLYTNKIKAILSTIAIMHSQKKNTDVLVCKLVFSFVQRSSKIKTKKKHYYEYITV